MGLWDGILLGVYMVGAGGIPTIIVAWMGRKKAVAAPKVEAVEVNSPWLVQNLLEIKMTVESTKAAVDALVVTQQTLITHVSTIAAQIKRLK